MAGLPKEIIILSAAAILAGVAAFWLYRVWDGHFGHATLAVKIGAVFVPGALAGGIYWGIATLARIPSASDMTRLVTRKLRK